MPDLILRPSERSKEKPWALQIRYNQCYGETDYKTLCFVDESTAHEIAEDVGDHIWLFGNPKNTNSSLLERLRTEDVGRAMMHYKEEREEAAKKIEELQKELDRS
jgi:hypothetical protein